MFVIQCVSEENKSGINDIIKNTKHRETKIKFKNMLKRISFRTKLVSSDKSNFSMERLVCCV